MFDFNHPIRSPLFDYYAPLGNHYRGLLSIPHSGQAIPEIFRPFMSGDESAYNEDVDFKVNELVDIPALQNAGVAVLVAHVHRICVDLNRAEENCVLFWKKNTLGQNLVLTEPTPIQIQDLIESYHRPYYEILKASIQDLEKKKSGPVSMIDLHSMPTTPMAYHMQQNPHQKMHRPDFCISDRKGLTCEASFIGYFQKNFQDQGYEASLNDPYVGGYITEYVNRFRTNNIQIEIKRGIYMDETSKQIIPSKAGIIKTHLTQTLISGFEKFDS